MDSHLSRYPAIIKTKKITLRFTLRMSSELNKVLLQSGAVGHTYSHYVGEHDLLYDLMLNSHGERMQCVITKIKYSLNIP